MQNLVNADSLVTSAQWFAQAKQWIPGGVNSPVRAFNAVGGIPPFIKSAQGAYLLDVEGKQYIDYVGSWGPMILGHAHPHVIAAVQQTCQRGLSFGAPCPLEVELAAEICSRIPSIEQVRMVNSGTEAAMTAIRLARGVTGRAKIIKFEGCYHGHADCLLVKSGSGTLTFGNPSSPGVPEATVADTLVARYNDLDSVAALFDTWPHQIAAIIVEPVAGNMNMVLPLPDFLSGLRSLCDQYQSLLIFDEVITGFRVGPQGAQGLFNIQPDITILGKIIGGGMPVGAFGARRDIMEQLSPQGPIYQAGTLSGNPLAMAAGLATLQTLQPQHYQQLNTNTAHLLAGIQHCAQAANIPLTTQHCGSLFGLFFSDEDSIHYYEQVMNCDKAKFTKFFNYLLNKGIYIAPSPFESGFVSLAHGIAEIETTLQIMEQALGSCTK